MHNDKVQEMLDLAEKDLARLDRAKSCAGAREAWISFLEHSNRAINRIEGYAKKRGFLDEYKALLKEIWGNDVAAYMRTARNTLEHGIQDVQVDDPYNERVVEPNGHITGAPIIIAQDLEGNEVYIPTQGPMEVLYSAPGIRTIKLNPGIMPIPVQDKSGRFIRPPHLSVLIREDESQAHQIARTYLQWVKAKIQSFS